jgi:phenylpropionate dioxygenase-like ring-hydroxylating dioxygenase large terminal subunit
MATAKRRPLSPYPNGWFALAFADELRRGSTLSRTLAGHEIVLFRTASGRACALDAHCPHLGAHLGYGGRVEGEVLRCPFHGFCFDGSGRCVATGYGTKPPPTAVSRSWPLVEVNGMLCAYYDADGRPPTWEIPQLETPGWSAPSYRRFEISAHPQETTENSVDLGHFAWVHGYRSVRMRRELVTDGPYLNSAFRVRRPMPLIGRLWYFEIDFETHIYGLGY